MGRAKSAASASMLSARPPNINPRPRNTPPPPPVAISGITNGQASPAAEKTPIMKQLQHQQPASAMAGVVGSGGAGGQGSNGSHAALGDFQEAGYRLRRRPSMHFSPFKRFIRNVHSDTMSDSDSFTVSFNPEPDMEDGPSSTPRKKTVDLRRLGMFEDVIVKLRDLGSGIELKDRSRLFKQYPQTFLGSELVDWLMLNCNLLTKEEATRFASGLFDAGYIIHVDLAEKFLPDSSAYVFQTSYLWPSVHQATSDKDYLAYLLRRNLRTSAKFQLSEIEDRRILRLKRKFRKHRQEFETLVQDQLDFFESLSKSDRRLFSIQEFAFWRMQRPLDPEAQYLPVREVDSLVKRSQTEAQYEARLSDPDRLEFWLKKKESLESSVTLNRVKISVAARSLVQRCEIMRPYDPFVDTTVNNPFITDDIKQWEVVKTQPTRHDLLVWCHSFYDLIRDPIGVRHFRQFLQTEYSTENLDFHLRVEALGSLVPYNQFLAEAESIFDEFIQVGSPRELNITAGTRSTLMERFANVRRIATARSQVESFASSAGSFEGVSVGVNGMERKMSVGAAMQNVATPPPPPTPSPALSSASLIPNHAAEHNNHSGIPAHFPIVAPPIPAGYTSPPASVIGRAGTAKKPANLAYARLPNFVFKEAQEHILMLMAKDSYIRFLNWEVLRNMMAREGIDQELLISLGIGGQRGRNMSISNLTLLG
ncbi:hypothetical protein HDU97_002193 [Phlyctochytrium planicorne]|nr:hypothetical protein HDU97_002193 [Phlyctochytrium planicorne]